MLVYNNFLKLLQLEEINLETDSIKAILRDNTQALDATKRYRSELSGEISGGGYPAGGIAVPGRSVEVDDDENLTRFLFEPIRYSNISGYLAYCDFYIDTGNASTDVLLFTLELPPCHPPSYTASTDNINVNCPEDGILIIEQGAGGGGGGADEKVKIDVSDTLSGYLSEKLSNAGNVQFSAVTETGVDKLKADVDLSGYLTSLEASETYQPLGDYLEVGGNISELINDAGYLNPYPKVISIRADQPVAPTLGDRYIIAVGATGAEWPARENEIAEWNGTFWTYFASSGALVFVTSETKIYYFDINDGWLELTDSLTPDLSGYLTSADAATTYQPIGTYLESGDNISELANDTGYITAASLPDLSGYLQSGDNVSELTNDAGYIGASGLASYVPYSIPDDTNKVLYQYRPATLNAINGTGTIVVLLDDQATTNNKYYSGVIRGHNYADRSEFVIKFSGLWYSASYSVATPTVLSVEGSAYFGSVRLGYDPSNRPCLFIGTTGYVWHADSRITLEQIYSDYFILADYQHIRDNAPVQSISRITSETGYTIRETKTVAAVNNFTNTNLVKVWGDATPWDYRYSIFTPKNVHLGSNTTGTVAVKLPAFVNTVYNIVEIKGFDYTSTTGGWKVTVSGLNTGTSWVNPSVNVEGKPPFTSVRVAYVGADPVILLGTTTTTWTRMVLSVDLHHKIGASTDPIYSNATDYTITTAITSEAAYSVKATFNVAFNAQIHYAAGGSAAAPTHSFYGAPNYGMWQSGTWLRFAAGGTDAFGITSLGLAHFGTLGIDNAQIGIRSSNTNYYTFRIRSNTNAGQTAPYLYFETNAQVPKAQFAPDWTWQTQAGSAAANAYALYGAAGNGMFFPTTSSTAFSSNSVERARFDSSGNLSIGATSAAQFVDIVKHQNAGTYARTYNNDSGTAGIAGFIASAQNNQMQFLAHGGGRVATRYGESLADATEFLSLSGASKVLFGAGTQNIPIIFGNNSVEAMRIDTSQNLALQNDLDLTAGGSILFSGSSYISNATLAGDWYLPSGTLGIGVTPNALYSLYTSGDIYTLGNFLSTGFADTSLGYKVGGVAGYTGDLNDSTSTKIADVVGGIITTTYY